MKDYPAEHDLFLLMLNLEQKENPGSILPVFLETVNAKQQDVTLRLLSVDEITPLEVVDILTPRNFFGRVSLEYHPEGGNAQWVQTLKNSLMMLAIVLENCKQRDIISKRNNLLEAEIKKRTSELLIINRRLEMEIAERILAENALKESRMKYVNMFETAPVSLWEEDYTEVRRAVDYLKVTGVADPERYLDENPEFLLRVFKNIRIVDANQASVKLFGARDKEELIGSLEKLTTPETIAMFRKQLIHIFHGNTFFESEAAFHTLQGNRLDTVIRLQLLQVPADMNRALVSHMDITERSQAAEQIKKLNEELESRVASRTQQLENAYKELESFSYSVSHDLRAPLRSMDGFSQVLLREYSDQLEHQAKNYINRISHASKRMGRLIDALLNLSQLSRSEMVLENIDLSKMARLIANQYRAKDPERDVRFVITDSAKTHCDQRLMQSVLENLIGNAWKFTGRNQSATIEFGMMEKDGQKVYYVRDDGAGFDMAYVDKLFTPFQRLHKVNEFEGTGIGLANVQRIIQRHGGRIWAESEVDKGATFYFTLNWQEGGHGSK